MANYILRAFVGIIAYVSISSAQECSGNAAICPNNQDGVSSTYLQCDSWAGTYITVNCPAGQVCFASPTKPNVISCAPPDTGSVPSAGECSTAYAKCADSGKSGTYYSCETWSGKFVNSECPTGLICYNRKNTPGVVDYRQYDDVGHVRGGWAGHVYLEIRANRQLDQIATRCIDMVCSQPEDGMQIAGSQMRAISSLHISLTRPFYLQEHQITVFMNALRRATDRCRAFTIGFGGLSTYVNERGDRGFVALDVDAGLDGLTDMLDRVDRVMEQMGKRRFFSRPRFHVSVVSADLLDGQMESAMDAVGVMLGTAMQEEILRLAATRIDTLECVFGDKRFSITLG
ncbi:poly(U)-specific 3'-to-5' RNA exonuclease [Coemansia sp. RSA 2703]|nr:poly(U)-specific 3'-to-5' RNA exonuclease [Coemansia sp. RSA 2703]